jgi:hypothetical protein
MRRSRKIFRPADPEQIALRKAMERERERLADREPGRWGVNAAGLALPENEAISVDADSGGRVTRARRQDIFDLMKGRGKLNARAYDAIRRLQDDIAILHRGAASSGDYSPRVDRSRTSHTFTDTRHQASCRIQAALELSGPTNARLLSALCEAGAALAAPTDWRMLVMRETGETLPDAQAAILRGACDNLAGAYSIIDRGRGMAGAAFNDCRHGQ